jgi:glycosyltransferase involved in cell wall biosynthesis
MKLSVPMRRGRVQHVHNLLDRQRRLKRLDYDVFHAPNPYMSAVYTQGRNVVSVLDLIPLDLDHYRQLGLNAHLFLKILSPRADRILSLSHFTAERIVDLLGVGGEKIIVASLPPADIFHPRPKGSAEEWLLRRGIRHPYVLAVADGRIHDPRKRSEWLPAIGRQLKRAGSQLVVVGPKSQLLFEPDAGVVTLGQVADEELAQLMAAARTLVFTSAYEGQGMPLLEAMACGTPVVAMRNTSIPEVVGRGGILVDEKPGGSQTAAEELAKVCIELTRDEDEHDRLGHLALQQSSSFTLSAFGAALSRAYLD